MILSLDKLDRLISRADHYMLAGFALTLFGFGIGAISAINLVGLGASLACVRDYRREPGLWMLALFFGCVSLGFIFLSEYGAINDFVRGGRQAPWLIVIDFALALRFQWLIVKAMATVVVHNRCLMSADS